MQKVWCKNAILI